MKKETNAIGILPLAILHNQFANMKKGLLLIVALFAITSVFAVTPITGIKTIAASGGDYTSVAAAISALNTNGVGTNGVTFNIPAGWTETFSTASAGNISAVGTSANQIIFQKSGSGTNPLITSAAGSGIADYIIKITGSYITFNGIDVQNASTNTATTPASNTDMEYGYWIAGATGAGATYNTIQNCTITLDHSNTNANYGIYQLSAATSAAGENNNNTYSGVTITNASNGIYLAGKSTTYYDFSCVISNCIIGKSANDIQFATSNFGIQVSNQSGFTISGNNVGNVTAYTTTGSSSNGPTGIYFNACAGTNNIYNNKVHDISNFYTNATGNSSLITYGINNNSTTGTFNFYNNYISGVYCAQTTAKAGTGFSAEAFTNSGACTVNLFFNTIYLQSYSGSFTANVFTFQNACLYFTAGTVTATNNILVNVSVNAGSKSGYCFYAKATTITASDYNIFYNKQATPAVPYLVGAFGSAPTDAATLANWQAVQTSIDAHSNYFLPTFTSTTIGSEDLSLNLSGQPAANTYQGTPISTPSITTDYGGNTRNTAVPYIGANENTTYSLCTTAGTTNPSAVSACTAGSAATMSVTGSGTSATYKWQYSPDNGTTAWASVGNGTPSNISYTGNTTNTLSITAATGATSGAGGYYRCAVTTACNSSTANSTGAQLTVNQSISIGTSPSAASVTISGSAATMSVSSVTGTSPTYQWQRATTSGGTYSNVVNATPTGVTYSGATGTTLSITAGSTATTGTNNYYQCVVTGTCGAVSSGNAALTINAAGLSTPPTLAATASQTVDNDFAITYTDNTDWDGKVTGITVDGGSTLSGSTYYTTPASGTISLKTSAITALQSAGSHTILIKATGYNDASITKTNIAGTSTKLALGTALAAPATNGGLFATQPTITIQDQYGNVTTSTANVAASVTSGQTSSWSIGGSQASGLAAVAGTTTFTNLKAYTTGAAYNNATITFTCGSLTSVASAAFNIAAYSSSTTDYFRSNGTGGGTWGTASTWQSSPDNSLWFTATSAPTAAAVGIDVQSGDVVTIASAVTIGTITTNLVAATVEGELDVNASNTLTIASGSSLTVTGTLVNLNASTTAIVTTGTLSFGSTGIYTLNIGSSGTPATTGEIPAATWNAASTINLNGYYGTVNMTTTASSTYGNINVNGIVSGTMVLLPASYQNIAGNLTITPAGAYGGSGQLQIMSSGGTNYLTIGGNYVQQGGLVLQDPSSGSTTCRPMVVLGNFTMDASAGYGNPSFKVNSGASVGNLIIMGNVSLTNATFSNTSSGISNVYFAGSTQTFTASGTNSFGVGTGSLNWYVNSGTNLDLGTNVLGGTTFNTNGAYTYSSFTGTTSTLTTSTNNVTNNTLITVASSTTGLQPGMTISGAGIPANTVIVSVNVVGTSTIQISKPATAANTGVTFTVSSAATSTVQSAHLSGLNGNITTTGTNSLDAGTNYVFNASTGAQVTGALLTAANNLTINNSSGVSLSANTTVSGTLTLTSGNLTLGAYNLILSNSISGTTSASKHIVTSGAGYLQNTYSSGSSTFPVGFDASNYNPVQITNNAAASQSYTVRAVTTSSVLSLTNSLKASWSIGGITQSSSAISFLWNSSNDVTATAPTSGIVFYSNGTSSWSSPGGSTSGSSPSYTSTVTGVAASSAANYWTVAPCTNASTSDPSNASACSSGSAATMSVTGTGTALTYQWKYASTSGGSYSNVVDGTPTGVTYGGSGTAATLSATAGSTSVAGNSFYKCAVSAACGSAATSAAAQLTISKAIVIGTNPSATSAAINGSAATMSVSVTGTSPTYQWVRSSSSGGTYANVVDGTPTGVTYSGSNSSTLSITADATATTGTHDYYKCIVSGASPCGSATSTNAALTINAAAALTPPTLSATSNQSVDNDLSITYPNNTNWNGNVNGITVDGGSTLTGSAYYSTPSAGSVNIHTAAIAALQTPGSHTIVISAATYNDATLVTTTSAGTATQLTINSIPGSQTAGSTFSVTVTALDQYGNTSNSSAAVSLASSGSGILSGNTGNLSSGTLTLNSVTYTKAQTVTFTASSTGITSSSASNSVTFGAGTATKLVLATIASPQTVSTAFSVTVTAQDAYGNNATSAAAVTLAASGSGTLTGNTGSLSSGMLTLSSVKYTKAESVTFTASASGLTTSTASNAVVFNAGPATKLSITTIATQSVGVGFGVVVTATDANGNPANVTSNSLITLTQASGTASNLAGTLTGTITSGTSSVTISGVVYNKVENTSITATQSSGTPTLTAITSNIFTVSILTYYSKTSGTMNWTDATWGLSVSGPFNQPITTSGLDNVVIQSGGTVNLNTNYTTSTGTIIVTGTLNISSGYKLTSGAALTVSASTGVLNIANGVTSVATNAGSTNGTLEITAGTFTINGIMDVSGYFKNSDATAIVYGASPTTTFENYSVCELNSTSITSTPTATWNANSTLLISACNSSSSYTYLVNNVHYGNVIVNSTGGFYFNTNTSPVVFIDGNLSILSTGGSGNTLKMFRTTGAATRLLTIAGDFTTSGSTYALSFDNNASTGVSSITVGGSLSGALFTTNGGVYSSGTCTFNLTGVGKSINTSYDFRNWAIKVASSASYTLGASVALSTSSGNSLYTTFENDGVLDCSTFTISGASNVLATFNLASGATLKTANVGGLSAAISTFGTKTLNPAANYIFNGSTAQVTGALLTAANNLTINNSAGVTLSAATNVTGILTLNGGVLATGANALTISGTIAYTSGGIDASNAAGTLVFAKSGTTTLSSGIISANINNLTINSGVVLNTIAALNVNKAFTNNGSVSGVSTINLVGSTSQTIAGTGSLAKLSLNNSNGATVSSGLQSITELLTVSSGNLNAGTNGLTLKSTSITNSAVVDQVGGTITGTVTVERYIPAKYLGYRDMAPEVYGAGTINANWQEGATNGALNSAASNPHPGYGIFITGSDATYTSASNAGGIDANGFDKSGTGGSLNTQDYTYNPTYNNPATGYGHFKAFPNTSANLDAFTGYRLLIRGDRSPNLYTDPIHKLNNNDSYKLMYNATTLRATGNLVYGTVTYNTLANGGVVNAATGGNAAVGLNPLPNGFSMVANPYVCPVQWNTVYSASTAAAPGGSPGGINGSYWYLDPTTSSTGKYIAFNALTGAASVGGLGTYSNTGTVPVSNGYIQPGQAVFVQSLTASPKVVFQEAAKVASATKTGVFGTSSLSKIYVSLWKQANGATTYDKVDGAAVAFRFDFGNATYGPQDATKFNGATDNLSISDKGKNLSIDGRLPATASDAIALVISKPSTKTYQLQVDASTYISNGFAPILYDAFKNTTKALSTGITTLDVTIDTAIAASYSNRFSILFAPSALPVNSIVASATLSNKVATITWNTVGEKGVARYEVEKSTDAKTFTTIGQATAKNTATASYATTDNSVTATTYYRIKAVSTTGATSYSNVSKVQLSVNSNQYTVYPNPLKGSTLNLTLDNVIAGKYIISIYNTLGEKVHEQTISHTGGSATHAISTINTLAAGMYSVTISEAGSKQMVHQSNLSVQP